MLAFLWRLRSEEIASGSWWNATSGMIMLELTGERIARNEINYFEEEQDSGTHSSF